MNEWRELACTRVSTSMGHKRMHARFSRQAPRVRAGGHNALPAQHILVARPRGLIHRYFLTCCNLCQVICSRGRCVPGTQGRPLSRLPEAGKWRHACAKSFFDTVACRMQNFLAETFSHKFRFAASQNIETRHQGLRASAQARAQARVQALGPN
jgi:hypothetical protein